MKPKYPTAIVIPYGPNDKTVTKLVASVMDSSDRILATERWVASDILNDEQIARQMYEFMRTYGTKTVVSATAVLGCPHEEGEDFPEGEDCPFCPFWKGKQGSGTTDSRWDALKSVRQERLGFSYRFWLP